MDHGSVEQLINYLMRLAPDFFGARIKPANEADIDRLAETAVRRVPQYHRNFLLAAGRTAPRSLDPFLNARVFDIDSLGRGYMALAEYGTPMPDDISIFSAWERIEEFEFLRADDGDAQPQIGGVDVDSGVFFIDEIGTLENYLFNFAFTFRVAQLDHILAFSPMEDRAPGPALAVMDRMGLEPVFRFPVNQTCLEGGPWAAVVFDDGTGHIASDDHKALVEICELLADNAGMKIKPRPNRLVAPKR